MQQLFPYFSNDFITIYDINKDGNSTVIARLNGPDSGPQLYYSLSRWQKKIISSTSNKMLVEFRSEDGVKAHGFSAFIHYSLMPNKQCAKGLNMIMKTIQSLNYPNWYDNNIACKWLISVPHGSHIRLKFVTFDVSFSIIIISNSFSENFYCLFH